MRIPVLPTKGGGGSPRRRRKGNNPTGPTKLEREQNRIHKEQVAETNRNSRDQRPPASNHAAAAAARANRTRPSAPVVSAPKKKSNNNSQKGKPNAQVTPAVGSRTGGSGPSNSKPSGSGRGNGPGKTGGNKGKNHGHGKGKGKGNNKPGKVAAATVYKKDRAASAVDLMLDPKLDALQGEVQDITSEYSKQKADLNTQTEAQLGDLAVTYKQLDNMLAQYAQQSDQSFANADQAQNAGFDQLQQALQGQAAGAQGQVGNELARLGIGAESVDQSELTGDAAFTQGQAVNNRAMAAATMAAMRANQSQYNQASRGNSQAMGTQAQQVARQSAVQMLNDLLAERNKGVRTVNREITSTEGQRGQLENQLREQYEQQAYERMMEQRQQQFMNSMGVSEFNLKSDQFNADQAYRNAQLALQGEELKQRSSQSQASQKNGGYATGFSGAQQYLNQNAQDPKRRAALMSILQKIDTHRQRGDGYYDWSQGNPGDVGKALNFAYNFLDEPGFGMVNNARSRSLLKQALDAYFGKR